MAATQCDKIANVVRLFLFDVYSGHNHVNETVRHGIVAHRLWDENLGNGTEVIVTIPLGSLLKVFGFVALTFAVITCFCYVLIIL